MSQAEAHHALKQANRAAKIGKLAEAERWTKLAQRHAAAAERLATLPPPVNEEENLAELQAELRRRIAVYVEESVAIDAWEAEAAAHEAQTLAAQANNLEPPAPMRPHPAGPLSADEYLKSLLVSGDNE